MNYEIDELIDIFEKHSIEFQKQNMINKEKYPEINLDTDRYFDLPQALVTICKEIKNLKAR